MLAEDINKVRGEDKLTMFTMQLLEFVQQRLYWEANNNIVLRTLLVILIIVFCTALHCTALLCYCTIYHSSAFFISLSLHLLSSPDVTSPVLSLLLSPVSHAALGEQKSPSGVMQRPSRSFERQGSRSSTACQASAGWSRSCCWAREEILSIKPRWSLTEGMYVMLCYVMLCYVMLCYFLICHIIVSYVILCSVTLCCAIWCYVTFCYVMWCYGILRYISSVEDCCQLTCFNSENLVKLFLMWK